LRNWSVVERICFGSGSPRAGVRSPHRKATLPWWLRAWWRRRPAHGLGVVGPDAEDLGRR